MASRDVIEEAPNLEIGNERSAADPCETDLAGIGHLVKCRAGDRELTQGVVHAPRVWPPRGGWWDSLLVGAVGLKRLQRNHLVVVRSGSLLITQDCAVVGQSGPAAAWPYLVLFGPIWPRI
jgi:hypothetical protein